MTHPPNSTSLVTDDATPTMQCNTQDAMQTSDMEGRICWTQNTQKHQNMCFGLIFFIQKTCWLGLKLASKHEFAPSLPKNELTRTVHVDSYTQMS